MQRICGIELASNFVCHEIIYADDILLIDMFGENLQAYMDCVAAQERTYGLELNFFKVECMPVNCECIITDSEGKEIQTKTKFKYLGAHIAADGTIDSELSQRLGIAAQEFKLLQQVWTHSSLSRQFKFQVYIVCIVQKLRYGFEGAWLNAAVRRKLNGFHARCLRKI